VRAATTSTTGIAWKAKTKVAPGTLSAKGSVPPAQVAEDEGGAGPGRRFEQRDRPVEASEEVADGGDLQEDQDDRELQDQSGHDVPPVDPAPLFADDPGQARQDDNAEERLQHQATPFFDSALK
jgi:hypothetical protein